jgi:aspartyl-tRNA(Asn)/glutamyl-tRNA(Gln) amidotransferase subunit A
VAEAARGLQHREFSAADLTGAVLARAEAVDPVLHAFETIAAESALAEAAASDERRQTDGGLGPLDGIPMVIKDIIDTAGLRTSSSSRLWNDRVPSADAAVVERLRQAGVVIAGKTVTHEFAFGVISPPTRTPWKTDHISGGSSGGSAAAVAADACIAAIGTDTGGSIRIPAANCGIVGVLPTYGRVSKRGVAPLSWSLDVVGPMTKTVEDAATVLQAIAGPDPRDRTTLDEPVPDFKADLRDDLQGIRVGVPRNYFFDMTMPHVEAAVRTALSHMAALHADVVEVDVPGIENAHAIQYGILSPEAGSYHQAWIRAQGEAYKDDVRLHLDLAQFVPATHYVNAQRLRNVIRDGFRSAFEEHALDALIAPATPEVAVPEGRLTINIPRFGEQSVIGAYVRQNCPFNLAGLPVMSLPCGFTDAGLPIGMQIAARPLQEARMFRVAHAYEQSTEWHRRDPDLLLE